MKKVIWIFLVLSSGVFADHYYLVVSKEPEVCQFTYKIFNQDLKKYGKLELEKREEFQAIKWDKKFKFFRGDGTPTKHCFSEDLGCKNAIFDINNDGKDEMVAFRGRHVSSRAYRLNTINYMAFDGNNNTDFYFKNTTSVKSLKLKKFPIYATENYTTRSGKAFTVERTLSLSSLVVVLKPFKFNNQIYLAYGKEDMQILGEKGIKKESTKLDIERNGLISIVKFDSSNQMNNICVLIRARTTNN